MERWEEGGRIKDGEIGDMEDEGIRGRWRDRRQKDGKNGGEMERWRGGKWRDGKMEGWKTNQRERAGWKIEGWGKMGG